MPVPKAKIQRALARRCRKRLEPGVDVLVFVDYLVFLRALAERSRLELIATSSGPSSARQRKLKRKNVENATTHVLKRLNLE